MNTPVSGIIREYERKARLIPKADLTVKTVVAEFGQVVKGMDVVRAIQQRDAKGSIDNLQTQGQCLSAPVITPKAKRK